MGAYLNSGSPYKKYHAVVTDSYFVDKTCFICEFFEALGKERRYFCITRPRRFGKTVMANMMAAYFCRAIDSSQIFNKLKIASCAGYLKHLNSHDVIFIDFSRTPQNCRSFRQYIERIQNGIKNDLEEMYPECKGGGDEAVWDILGEICRKRGRAFIFIMDEWDAVFHVPYFTREDQKEYLLFLKNLLKDQDYVELAYMTGILPIAKYSGGSELNMFAEYQMTAKERFGSYFGFSEEETDRLYAEYRKRNPNGSITREALAWWYDGYCTADGTKIYNPRSVVQALSDSQLGNYWTGSGPYGEIFYYIRGNAAKVRDDLAYMMSGGRVEAGIQEYAATSKELRTKDQIYSAMVVYGLLAYENGEVFIPNKELMDKYKELLMADEELGYVHALAKESARMLKATLAGDTETMQQILKYAHDTESPISAYSSEAELAAVVNLVYLAARDKYRVEREDKAGEGYVDFIFYPQRREDDGIILELKTDSTPLKALQQIKDRNYILRFEGKLGERPKYTGRILGAGISYDRKTKEHFCRVEVLRRKITDAGSGD